MNSKIISAFVASFLTLPISAHAFYLVEDPIDIAKNTEIYQEAQQQYTQLTQNYQVLLNQYNTLQQQYKAVTGNYGWGGYQNTIQQLNTYREYAASDWQSALQGMSGGNPERYQELLQQYVQNHIAMSTQAYQNGSDQNLTKDYTNQVQTNQTSGTIATYEFNDINTHLQALYQLGQEIESNQNNDIKSAIDLNSRIELEVGYIAVEELRMQTLLNQQTSQLQSSQISQESEASQYNQAGESQS